MACRENFRESQSTCRIITMPATTVRSRNQGQQLNIRSTAKWAIILGAGWLLVTILLVAAGLLVKHSPSITSFDQDITRWVVAHRTSELTSILRASTWFGSWIALLGGSALIAALVLTRRLPSYAAVLAVVAWGGEAAGVALAKHIVRRARPPKDFWLITAHGWSWPSGHTATAAVAFSVSALAVSSVSPQRTLRALLWLGATIAIGMTAFSRVELGVHWTTDVIASTVYVAAWLIMLAFTVKMAHPHAPRAIPTRPTA
jgi:undecaprenyl-diphosphatase